MSRTFATSVEDLWDAFSNPERMARWFLPVDGDFRVGGRFHFVGNAGAEIRARARRSEEPERARDVS